MKLDIDYVNSFELKPPKQVKTQKGKIFYQHQINIKTDKSVMTIIMNSYFKDLKPKVEKEQKGKTEKK